jgi:hypothetical protein
MKSLFTRGKLLIVFVLLLSNGIVFGQKEAYRWYFGRKAGLDFNTTPPTMLSNGPYAGIGDVEEAHAAISDKNGNYLFYTNGQTIWDNTGTQMPNGTGILGNYSTTQCATVFPVPGSATDYYVLTTPVTGSSTELLWNRIDMSLNSGKGDIKTPVASNKNQSMPSCPSYMMESVVSVPHFNGTDIWVIAHTADDPGTAGTNEGGSFVVWLVTSAGIAYSHTNTLGYAYPQSAGTSRGIGIMKSNTCFTRVFISYYNASSRIEGFSFSNSTGVVSNWPAPVSGPLVIDQYRNSGGTMTAIGSYSYGLEVSGNGQYLYNTLSGEAGTPKELTQYDLQAGTGTTANIVNSAVRLTPASPDGDRYGQLQMGPDGKIYHTLHNWNNIGAGGYCKIGTIGSPNVGGTGANFVEAAYTWPAGATGVGSTMGLTSFHKGFLAGKAAITSTFANLQQICLGDVVDFSAQTSGATITMYKWNIDKNLNATIDYSGAGTSSISHTYAATGTYDVELTVTDQCGYDYSSISQVKVLPVANATGSVTCGVPNVSLNVTSTPTAGKSYVWYSDAAGTMPIASGASTTLPAPLSGNVYVKQVNTVTVTPTVSIPAQSAATASISAITGSTSLPSFVTSGTVRVTTLNVVRPLTLNSFNFVVYGDWSGTTGTYTVNVKNSSGTVVKTLNVTGSLNKNSPTITISGNNEMLFSFVPAGGVAMTAGTYTVELVRFSGTVGHMDIGEFNFSQLGSSSILGAISNAGDATSTTKTYITDINVSTPAVPAVMVDVITSTPLGCSNMSPAISANCPLPVTWLGFEAKRSGEGSSVLLSWSTGSEQNSKGFYIQRSTDGITFETIGYVNANGNSNGIIEYNYIDATAPAGIVYYKLEEEDYDGQTMFSQVKHVNGAGSLNLSLVPNPGNGGFKIVGLSANTELTISLISVTGQSIFTTTTSPEKFVDLSDLAKGFYIVKILSGSEIQSIRFINQ